MEYFNSILNCFGQIYFRGKINSLLHDSHQPHTKVCTFLEASGRAVLPAWTTATESATSHQPVSPLSGTTYRRDASSTEPPLPATHCRTWPSQPTTELGQTVIPVRNGFTPVILQGCLLCISQYSQAYHFSSKIINVIYNTPSPNRYCTLPQLSNKLGHT